MADKQTYEDLKKRVQELSQVISRYEVAAEKIMLSNSLLNTVLI